jgi:hypothetical protein
MQHLTTNRYMECDWALVEAGVSASEYREHYKPRRIWCNACGSDSFDADQLILPDEKEMALVKVPNIEAVVADISGMIDTARFAPKHLPEGPADAEYDPEKDKSEGNGQDYTHQQINDISMTGFNRLRERIMNAMADGYVQLIRIHWDDREMSASMDKGTMADSILETRANNLSLMAVYDDYETRVAVWQEGTLYISE